MRYHTAIYAASAAAAGATNNDTPAVVEQVLSIRNNHYIFPYDLSVRQAFAIGASLTDARLDSPSLAAPSRQHIWPVQRSATIPSRPYGRRLIKTPLKLPKNEEVALQLSNNLGAATEVEYGILQLTPPNWSGNLTPGQPLNPQGPAQLDIKITATITVTALTWTTAAMTFAENLKGGNYAVLGGNVQATSLLAWRLIFPYQMQGAMAPWRPGSLASQALGDTPEEYSWNMELGDLGYFNSFTPPQLETISLSGGGTAATGFLRLAYLGDQAPPGVTGLSFSTQG